MHSNRNPIGIFDSGIGGLTVTKAIIQTLPQENIIYLGDTARVPYGTRDTTTITKFALELTRFLLSQQVKALVVACNTISATCLEQIQQISPVPVIGVISPTVQNAVKTTKTGRIGIIGTNATVRSKIYEEKIKKQNKQMQVVAKACPLFVPLAEEGFLTHPATRLIAQEYLNEFQLPTIDTLILGCTHYPLLREVIQKTVGQEITLIDSAFPTAQELKNILEAKQLQNHEKHPEYRFYVTDAPQRVSQTAQLFFDNRFPGKLEKTEL